MKLGNNTCVLAILSILVFLFTMSCKTREITGNISRTEIQIKSLEKANQTKKEELTKIWVKKIQGKIFWNNREQSFRSNYKVIRDSVIVVSLLNPLGIEALRIFCTTDTFGFIDRVNRNYYIGNYKTLMNKIGYPIDYFVLQAVLLNEIVTLDSKTTQMIYRSTKNPTILNNKISINLTGQLEDIEGNDQTISYLIEFEPDHFNVVRNLITDLNNEKEIDLSYGNHFTIEGIQIPGFIKMAILSGGLNMKCDLTLDRVLINSDFSTTYTINPKYTKIDW